MKMHRMKFFRNAIIHVVNECSSHCALTTNDRKIFFFSFNKYNLIQHIKMYAQKSIENYYVPVKICKNLLDIL